MVNFGLNSASILGIFLAVAGASLYFLRSVRPELSRDHDIFFSAVGLLCGLILVFQGWRLDPILQFSQLLLAGSAVFFGVETIRMRAVTTEQAKRNTPIVDEERPVSRTRVYRAELDQLEPYEEEEEETYENRRLRGYSEPRTSRRTGYETGEPKSSRTRPASEGYRTRESTPKRRPRPSSTPTSQGYDEWQETPDHWEQSQRASSSRSRRPRSESSSSEGRSYPESRPRRTQKPRPRPSDVEVASVTDSEVTPTDYVDYHPVDKPETERSDWEQGANPKTNRNRDRRGDDSVHFDY